MRIVLIFAMMAEAQPSLDACGARLGQWTALGEGLEVLITISGMGALAAGGEAARWVESCDALWNYGIAGGLHSGVDFGTLYPVSMVSKHLSLPEGIHPRARHIAQEIFPSHRVASEGLHLVTSDYPIYDVEQLNHCALTWDLVDMEAYGICHVAQQWNKPCCIRKMVSDFADLSTEKIVRESIGEMAKQLAHALMADFEALKPDLCSAL